MADKNGKSIKLEVLDGVVDFRKKAAAGTYAVAEGLVKSDGEHGAMLDITAHGAMLSVSKCTL